MNLERFTELIATWYKENENGFADKYDAAVKEVSSMPPDTDPCVMHNWKNATIEDLCKFFRDWYAWNPEFSTSL